MKRIAFCLIGTLVALVFSGCLRRGVVDECNEVLETILIQEPLYDPVVEEDVYDKEVEYAYVSLRNVTKWPRPSRLLVPVAGVVTSFYGPMAEDGTVPWYIEWFEIEIEKDDGTPAIIIGLHDTGFIFGSRLESGMEVVAYIAYDSPVFVNEIPMYVATAIVAGMPSGSNVTVYATVADYNTDYFPFVVTDETDVAHVEWHREHSMLSRSIDNEDFAFGRWFAGQEDFYDSPVVVIYDTTYDGLPIASRIVVLRHDFPFPNWEVVKPDQYMSLAFMNHIFPTDAFEVLPLPIYVNGVEIDAPPPILAADGTTILVPFRSIFAAGIGFGNYAFLTNDGRLRFGGGGGGSENSHWQVGRASINGMGWSSRMCSPPIIVGGVIYVPFISAIGQSPFAGIWPFEDRIYAFGERYPLGTWVGHREWWSEDPLTAEELAEFPIAVNGVKVDAPPAIFHPEHRGLILVPFRPIFEALGYYIAAEDEDWFLFRNDLAEEEWLRVHHVVDGEIYIALQHYWLPFGLRSIIRDGQILIARW